MPQLALVDAPTDALGKLKAKRTDLRALAANLDIARGRLTDAENAESEALAAIGELGASEVAAMKEWAVAASDEPPPAIDAERRRELTKRLVEAQAQAAAARGAVTDLDARLADVSREVAAIEGDIAIAAADQLLDEFRRDVAELHVAAKAFSDRVARAYAAREAVLEQADAYRSRGQNDRAVPLLRMLELASGVAIPTIEPSAADVAKQLPHWQRRYVELLS